MIPYFDRFVDTREKRYHVLLIMLLLGLLIMTLSYLVLSFELIKLNSYDILYAFLEKPFINVTYISRIIADAISISEFSIPNILSLLIRNLGFLEIIVILLSLLSIGIVSSKRATAICLILCTMEGLCACFFVLHGLQASSLAIAIRDIQMIGFVILVVQTILLLMIIYHLYRQIRYYQNALRYQVYEIKEKEHMGY